MIEATVDKADLRKVEKALGDLSSKAPNVMKNAANKTAKESKKLLGKAAKKRYAVQNNAFSGRRKGEIDVIRASQRRLYAQLKSSSYRIGLGAFKISPSFGFDSDREKKPHANAAYMEYMRRPTPFVSAHALKGKGFVPLIKKGQEDRKAFLIRYTNVSKKGDISYHFDVAERLTSKRLKVRTLYNLSIPELIGNRYVYGTNESKIEDMLVEHVNQGIDKLTGGGSK